MFLLMGNAMLGMLVAIPLLSMWRLRPANVWLGLFIFSISLLGFADYHFRNPDMAGLFDWPLAALGTFYYFYVRGIIGLRNRLVHCLHFAPLVLFVGFLIWIRIHVPGWTVGYNHPVTVVFGKVLMAAQVLCVLYFLLIFRMLHLHRRRVRAFFSSTAHRDLQWLTWLTVVLILSFVSWAMIFQLGGHWIPALQICQTLMLYLVGWHGTRQMAIFHSSTATNLSAPATTPLLVQARIAPEKAESPALPELPELTVPADKYARSGMTEAARNLIGKRLHSRMTEARDFLHNDITLGTLAERIGTSPNLVSQYLNHELGVTFFDYINGHRVAAVEQRMRDPASEAMTLVDLALACGFNSKSTFNAAFKRVHGVTPSVWRKGLIPPAEMPVGSTRL